MFYGKYDIMSIGKFYLARRDIKTVAVAFLELRGSQISFCAFLLKREVMTMYMTWDIFLVFCTFLVALISLIVEIHNKKR